MIKIEKGVGMPVGTGRGRPKKYPFGEMEVGDSIFFPNEPKGSQSNPSMASKNFSAGKDIKFVSRAENGGVRIWRTE
jgi:hypothetical protein